ncbi:hypothetical protein F0562_004427 [Nyssa sinensis]|uniref:Glutaredoxin domain-containing protein n=1 Tax=Nyssa sinensis TaxID=561372 RepID=A0A5J5BYI3_9ASTE|nr:hypothetical protein F0562_004427 [Nyssa sinensis]
MGCATSKQPLCRNCRAPYSPMPRNSSMPVHHLPQREGDSYHVVALTSTTMGSLSLDSLNQNHHVKEDTASIEDDKKNKGGHDRGCKEFSMGLVEAKTWSNMIDEKIPKVVPKTPIRTPPGEPETINAWELMEGLEDTSPLRPPHHLRSFSFHVAPSSIPFPFDHPKSKLEENGDEMADNDSNSNSTYIISEFDSDVISTFRKALEELPPANPFHLKQLGEEKEQAVAGNHQSLEVTNGKNVNGDVTACKCPVRRERQGGVILHKPKRGCLWGKSTLGEQRKYGECMKRDRLEKVLEGCEMVEDGGRGGGVRGGVCEACGDVRFVPCETCSGSRKIYYGGDYDDEEEEEEECGDESEYGFQRCPDCNENGIIRCPICCD